MQLDGPREWREFQLGNDRLVVSRVADGRKADLLLVSEQGDMTRIPDTLPVLPGSDWWERPTCEPGHHCLASDGIVEVRGRCYALSPDRRSIEELNRPGADHNWTPQCVSEDFRAVLWVKRPGPSDTALFRLRDRQDGDMLRGFPGSDGTRRRRFAGTGRARAPAFEQPTQREEGDGGEQRGLKP